MTIRKIDTSGIEVQSQSAERAAPKPDRIASARRPVDAANVSKPRPNSQPDLRLLPGDPHANFKRLSAGRIFEDIANPDCDRFGRTPSKPVNAISRTGEAVS